MENGSSQNKKILKYLRTHKKGITPMDEEIEKAIQAYERKHK